GRWVVLERGTGKLLLDNASKGDAEAFAQWHCTRRLLAVFAAVLESDRLAGSGCSKHLLSRVRWLGGSQERVEILSSAPLRLSSMRRRLSAVEGLLCSVSARLARSRWYPIKNREENR